jgi:hypothetical protein
MASVTKMEIKTLVLLVPIQCMTCRMDVSVENMKTLELFDLIEYKYIKNVIYDDKKMINIWIETKQVTEKHKCTSFTFTLQYDKTHVKRYKIETPYDNFSWYQETVKKLVSIGKEKEEEEEEEDEDSSDEE